jgi:hypothetical protein
MENGFDFHDWAAVINGIRHAASISILFLINSVWVAWRLDAGKLFSKDNNCIVHVK